MIFWLLYWFGKNPTRFPFTAEWLNDRKSMMDFIVSETKMDENREECDRIDSNVVVKYLLDFAAGKKRKYEERLQENYIIRQVLAQTSSNVSVAQVLRFMGNSNKREKLK